MNYLKVIELWSEKNSGCIEHCSHYGEPGYSEPGKGIVFANWNNVPKRIQDGLEAQGYELEWADEWHVDYNNGKAYRTSPDSYGWQSRLMYSEAAGEYLTPDDGLESWVQECENNSNSALPSWWDAGDIAALGWVKQSKEYENGFHPGQNDSPEKIAAALVAERKDFLFQIGGVGQFDVRFHVWVKPS
jgi:hypothetical protein